MFLHSRHSKHTNHFVIKAYCLALGATLVIDGCEAPTKKVPVTTQTLGSQVRYGMGSFSITTPDSWGPAIGQNKIGGVLAEQRIEFDLPEGRMLVRSYGGQSPDCIKRWAAAFVEPGMQQRQISIDGRAGVELYNRQKRWEFVYWKHRVLLVYTTRFGNEV
jgi:hypothetical protein